MESDGQDQRRAAEYPQIQLASKLKGSHTQPETGSHDGALRSIEALVPQTKPDVLQLPFTHQT